MFTYAGTRKTKRLNLKPIKVTKVYCTDCYKPMIQRYYGEKEYICTNPMCERGEW